MLEDILPRVTHVAIGAHPDDLEFMAGHAVVECFEKLDRRFLGIVACSGAKDEETARVRWEEQCEAARLGKYAAVISFGLESTPLKQGVTKDFEKQLHPLFRAGLSRPVLYTHNPFDKHDTHVGVMRAVIKTLRALPLSQRPEHFFGCEVWRGLDWLPPSRKVLLDVTGGEHLLMDLMKVYRSQIAEKAYDEATMGRKRANATYLDAYSGDSMKFCEYAVDMTELLAADGPTLEAWTKAILDEFAEDVRERLLKSKGA